MLKKYIPPKVNPNDILESGMRVTIDIDTLIPHPKNNYFFDDIPEEDWGNFVESIKEEIKVPLKITTNRIIVSGHQRIKACKELGIKTVETDVKEYPDDDSVIWDLIKINIDSRNGLPKNQVKAGRCIKELARIRGIRQGSAGQSERQIDVGNNTMSNLAKELGVDLRTLQRYKQLADMIPELQDLIIDGKLSPNAARALVKHFPQNEQLEFIGSLDVTKNYTAKEIDTAVKQYKDQIASKDAQIESDRKKYAEDIQKRDAKIEADQKKYNDFVKQRDEKFSRERDKLNKELKSKDVEIERLYANPPKPADYDSTKKQNVLLQDKIEILNDRMRQLQSQVDAYNGQAQKYTEASEEYKKILKQRDEAMKELEQLKFESSAQFELAKLTVVVRDFLRNKLAPIKFLECFKSISTNPVVGDDLIDIIDMTEKWCAEMRNVTRNIEYHGGRSGKYVDVNVDVADGDIEYYA